MTTREELHGQWNQLKGKIRKQWGQITDDDLQRVQGNSEQLVGLLQQKTGQTREQLEEFLSKAVEDGQNLWNSAGDSVRHTADQATRAVREQYQAAEQYAEEGYREAQRMVRNRPLESLATAFGAGLITGVVVSLLLRGPRS